MFRPEKNAKQESPCPLTGTRSNRRTAKKQKFFASFFQKRSPSFLLSTAKP
jgi:hypothetical protein